MPERRGGQQTGQQAVTHALEPVPGNTHAVQHGAYGAGNRVLAPRVRELAEALLQRAAGG